MLSYNFDQDYKYLIEIFGEDKLREKRELIYIASTEISKKYFSKNQLDRMAISDDLLNRTIECYFSDIHRMKEFHKIEKINSLRVAAYLSYWYYKNNPTMIFPSEEKKEEPDHIYTLYPNQLVATYLLFMLAFKFDKETGTPFHNSIGKIQENQDKFKYLIHEIIYTFIYRSPSPQTLELAITSFYCSNSKNLILEHGEIKKSCQNKKDLSKHTD